MENFKPNEQELWLLSFLHNDYPIVHRTDLSDEREAVANSLVERGILKYDQMSQHYSLSTQALHWMVDRDEEIEDE